MRKAGGFFLALMHNATLLVMSRLLPLWCLLLSICFSVPTARAQVSVVDSLERSYEQASSDSARIEILGKQVFAWFRVNADSALPVIAKIAALSEQADSERGRSIATHHTGIYWYYRSHLDSAIYYLEKAVAIRRELPSLNSYQGALSNLASMHLMDENYDAALRIYFESLDVIGKMPAGDDQDQALCTLYLNFGLVYYRQGDYEAALEKNQQALELAVLVDDVNAQIKAKNNFGLVYKSTGDTVAALEVYQEAMHLADDAGDLYTLAEIYNNLANLYSSSGLEELGLEYHIKALQISIDLGLGSSTAISYLNIAQSYTDLERYDEALAQVDLAEAALAGSDNYEILQEFFGTKANVLHLLGRSDEAVPYYQLNIQAIDSFNARRYKTTLAEVEDDYRSKLQRARIDSLESEAALGEAREIAQEAENNVLFWIILSVVVLALGVAVILFLKVADNRKLQSQKRTIEERNEALQGANEQITQQRDLIEEKNQDIMGSITYAERIQGQLLPSARQLAAVWPQSFVLYQPKDIVSGDFYWVKESAGRFLAAVVDCTGHGVPGALVSMVGHNGLTRTLSDQPAAGPAAILEGLNESVLEAFGGKDLEETAMKDGMDLALVSWDSSSSELCYSGANNPLYVVRNQATLMVDGKQQESAMSSADGNWHLFEIKADKQPIGHFENRVPFTDKRCGLASGDILYLASDGYMDQFGGEKGKKLKSKPFKQLLLDGAGSSMQEQQSKLHAFFEQWCADNEQIDDVCVMGLRV